MKACSAHPCDMRSWGAGARKCPNCGREAEANEKFCSKCGVKLQHGSKIQADAGGIDVKIEDVRKKARITTEKELIRDAVRGRSFSGLETLRQGMNLIDFALRVKKIRYEDD